MVFFLHRLAQPNSPLGHSSRLGTTCYTGDKQESMTPQAAPDHDEIAKLVEVNDTGSLK
jgi:hypothetical protein